MSITTVQDGPRKVTRTAEVAAPAAEVFDLVADPHRHGELDGSGTVKDTVSGPARLADGDRFSVRMKQDGVPYRITSRVTHLVDGQVVEWRHSAGHRWRWELTALSPTSTRVTETFDYSTVNGVQAKVLELVGIPKRNAAGIEATLRRLQTRFSGWRAARGSSTRRPGDLVGPGGVPAAGPPQRYVPGAGAGAGADAAQRRRVAHRVREVADDQQPERQGGPVVQQGRAGARLTSVSPLTCMTTPLSRSTPDRTRAERGVESGRR